MSFSRIFAAGEAATEGESFGLRKPNKISWQVRSDLAELAFAEAMTFEVERRSGAN